MNDEHHGRVVLDLSEILFECTGATAATYEIMHKQGYINDDFDPLTALEGLVVDLFEGTLSKDDLIDHNNYVLGEILPEQRTVRDRMFVEIGELAVKHLCPLVEDNYHLQGIHTEQATLIVDLFQPQDPEWLWSEARHESAGL